MSDVTPEEEAGLVEQTNNGPRPEDGPQPDDQQHTEPRTDLLPEED